MNAWAGSFRCTPTTGWISRLFMPAISPLRSDLKTPVPAIRSAIRKRPIVLGVDGISRSLLFVLLSSRRPKQARKRWASPSRSSQKKTRLSRHIRMRKQGRRLSPAWVNSIWRSSSTGCCANSRLRQMSASRRSPTRRPSAGHADVENKYARQSGGQGQYGHVKISVEPNPGKGYEFVNAITGGAIPKEPAAGPIAAIIIDDVGYNMEIVRALSALGKPLTVAVLPSCPHTGDAARAAAASGLEVMLHLPLEALAPSAARAPGTIDTTMNEADIERRVAEFLDQIPSVRGVNNHAGSKATEDPAVMDDILKVIKERGLYFIDSRTSRRTVAFDAARALAFRPPPGAFSSISRRGGTRSASAWPSCSASPGRRARPWPSGTLVRRRWKRSERDWPWPIRKGSALDSRLPAKPPSR